MMQKVLPKVHGSRRRVEPVLTALDALAQGAGPAPRMPVTHRKIGRMIESVVRTSSSASRVTMRQNRSSCRFECRRPRRRKAEDRQSPCRPTRRYPVGDLALREAGVYRYELSTEATNVEVEPREVFDPDDASWTRGRLRPGQAVGRLRIQVVDCTTRLSGTADIEVLAVKLDHETEYRQMLTDISSFAAEAVLQGFAPTMLDLAPSELPVELLYLRFAVIAAYLQDPAFEAAIARVTSQPHRTWVSEQRIPSIWATVSSGGRFSSRSVRPVGRVPWQIGRPPSSLACCSDA